MFPIVIIYDRDPDSCWDNPGTTYLVLCLIEIDLLFSDESWGTRHTFTLMGFLGITVSYIMRMNLSVTIVAMVDHCKES